MPRAMEFARFTCRLMTSIAMAASALMTGPHVAVAEPPAPAAAPPAAAGGQWIHVDPATGQRTAPPQGEERPANPAFSTSHEGLQEEPAPGGGVMIDLKGRFQSGTKATVLPDGSVTHDPVGSGTTAPKD